MAGRCPRTGKQKYPTPVDVLFAAAKQHWRRARTYAYWCPHCGWAHLTKKSRP